ncbi:MAG: hypothetical protein R2711_18835 [Acidimicrobiales bacterium]
MLSPAPSPSGRAGSTRRGLDLDHDAFVANLVAMGASLIEARAAN